MRASVLGLVAGILLSSACARVDPQAPVATAAAGPRQRVPHSTIVRHAAARQGAPILLAQVDGTLLAYVADEDDRAVHVIDVDAQTELETVPLAGAPAELVMLPDGRLLASLRDTNVVALLQGTGTKESPLAVVRRIDTPVEPIGLALTPDDSTLLVAAGGATQSLRTRPSASPRSTSGMCRASRVPSWCRTTASAPPSATQWAPSSRPSI